MSVVIVTFLHCVVILRSQVPSSAVLSIIAYTGEDNFLFPEMDYHCQKISLPRKWNDDRLLLSSESRDKN